jgi:uncharacterized protein (UPF0332 family)
MKEITADYMRKAAGLLREAGEMVEAGFCEAAGRNAYLSVLHAANAAIFEDSGIAVGKHKSTPQALSRMLHSRGINNSAITAVLPKLMRLKEIADYETGGEGITKERAEQAIADASDFVKRMEALINETPAAVVIAP